MSGILYCTLDEQNGVVMTDLDGYRAWKAAGGSRSVMETENPDWGYLSTVLLPTDHGDDDTPERFETMFFASSDESAHLDEDCARCATWDEALAQHEAMLVTCGPPPSKGT